MNNDDFLYELSVVVYKTSIDISVKTSKGYELKDPHVIGVLEIAKQNLLAKVAERTTPGEPLNIPQSEVDEGAKPALPKTVDEAIEYLLLRFNGSDDLFLKMSEDQFAAFCHSQGSGGIGMNIRNEFGFWTKDTDIYKAMSELLPADCQHPDDMSDYLIREVYKRKNNE